MKYSFMRCACWLLLGWSGLLVMVTPAQAATQITVTTISDAIADDGQCSLREAVIAANTDSTFHDCPAGSGADTILFAGQLPKPVVITLTQTGADEAQAQTGDLDIVGALTISGTSSSTAGVAPLVIDGNQSDRVFEVLSGANVNMIGVTIRHGNPGGAANGGGVLINLTAQLTLTNSQVISNSALSGGGLYGLGRLTLNSSSVNDNQGGGISNQGGLLTLKNVTVSNNSVGYGIRNEGNGALTFISGTVAANVGGIYNASATANLSNLLVLTNTGSGLYNTGFSLTHLTLTRSTVLSNTATAGAGLLNEGVGAILDIIDSRISGNSATSSGGGIFNSGVLSVRGSTIDHNRARAGAGLHHFGGNLSLSNATLSQNSASDNGGGLYSHASAVLKFVTFYANGANGSGGNIFIDEASLSIDNTIVAQAANGGNCVKSGGFLTSLGYNLESAATCNFSANGDLVNTDPMLGGLSDNGGPTLTHALLMGSPAIDQGSSSGCPGTDQRGVARPQGTGCDMGAYEWAANVTPTPTPSVTPTTTVTPTATPTIVPTVPPTITVTPTPVPTKPPVGSVQLKLTPAKPTTNNVISITVSGIYTTSCVPQYQAHQVNGHVIAIQSQLPDQTFCLPAEFPWHYTIQVGPLSAGLYTVTHTLEGHVTSLVFTVTAAAQCQRVAAALNQSTEMAVADDPRLYGVAHTIWQAPVQLFLPAIGNAVNKCP